MTDDESKKKSGKKDDLRVVDVEKVDEKEDLVDELSACFDDLCDADADGVKKEAAREGDFDSGAVGPDEPGENPPPEEGPRAGKPDMTREVFARFDSIFVGADNDSEDDALSGETGAEPAEKEIPPADDGASLEIEKDSGTDNRSEDARIASEPDAAETGAEIRSLSDAEPADSKAEPVSEPARAEEIHKPEKRVDLKQAVFECFDEICKPGVEGEEAEASEKDEAPPMPAKEVENAEPGKFTKPADGEEKGSPKAGLADAVYERFNELCIDDSEEAFDKDSIELESADEAGSDTPIPPVARESAEPVAPDAELGEDSPAAAPEAEPGFPASGTPVASEDTKVSSHSMTASRAAGSTRKPLAYVAFAGLFLAACAAAAFFFFRPAPPPPPAAPARVAVKTPAPPAPPAAAVKTDRPPAAPAENPPADAEETTEAPAVQAHGPAVSEAVPAESPENAGEKAREVVEVEKQLAGVPTIKSDESGVAAVEGPEPPRVPDKDPAEAVQRAAEAEIRAFLASWEKAWEGSAGDGGDIEPYIAHFSKDFAANGMDRAAWKADKAAKNRRKAWIQIGIDGIRVAPVAEGEPSRVTFLQSYESSNYSDATEKTLVLVREEGAWKILGFGD